MINLSEISLNNYPKCLTCVAFNRHAWIKNLLESKKSLEEQKEKEKAYEALPWYKRWPFSQSPYQHWINEAMDQGYYEQCCEQGFCRLNPRHIQKNIESVCMQYDRYDLGFETAQELIDKYSEK